MKHNHQDVRMLDHDASTSHDDSAGLQNGTRWSGSVSRVGRAFQQLLNHVDCCNRIGADEARDRYSPLARAHSQTLRKATSTTCTEVKERTQRMPRISSACRVLFCPRFGSLCELLAIRVERFANVSFQRMLAVRLLQQRMHAIQHCKFIRSDSAPEANGALTMLRSQHW